MTKIILGAEPLTLNQLRAVLDGPVTVEVAPSAWANVEKSAATVAAIIAEGRTVYGINTGFGLLANTSIAPGDLETLQKNLVLSHACGVGPLLDDAVVRLILVLKIASLSKGASGVRRETLEALIALVNADVLPCIPSKGSVGASGDLAPLAHMSCVLIGVGEARHEGETLDAETALAQAGLSVADARPQGGPRPPERHPVLDGAGAGRPVRDRGRLRRRDRRRGPVGRCAEGLRRPVRRIASTPCATSPARSTSPPPCAP